MKSKKTDFSQQKLDQLVTKKILRFDDIIQITGLSRSTIYRRMHANEFPQSISLGGRSIGWYESEVNEWLEGLRHSDT